MPAPSPVRVKRRLTPLMPASARRIAPGSIPISSATAMAASAFWTLCSPTSGRCRSGMVRPWPVRSVITTSNRPPAAESRTFTARTSACGDRP
jgi:hypothetical protein